jgi:hypothetical protein
MRLLFGRVADTDRAKAFARCRPLEGEIDLAGFVDLPEQYADLSRHHRAHLKRRSFDIKRVADQRRLDTFRVDDFTRLVVADICGLSSDVRDVQDQQIIAGCRFGEDFDFHERSLLEAALFRHECTSHTEKHSRDGEASSLSLGTEVDGDCGFCGVLRDDRRGEDAECKDYVVWFHRICLSDTKLHFRPVGLEIDHISVWME